MPTKNCCKYNNIWNSIARRYRLCKNKKCYGNFCYIHYKLAYNEIAIIIQKIYKGYYIRKKLKIYYNLPCYLQRKIVWHINSDLYLRNYNSSVSKLIYNKYYTFYIQYIYTNPYIYDYLPYIYLNSKLSINFYNDLIHLLKLSIKYYPIIKIKKIPYYVNFKNLYNIMRVDILHNINSSDNIIYEKYDKLFY